MKPKKAYTFDDFLLEPQYLHFSSRKEVDLTMDLGVFKLPIPIFSANMSTVTGKDMAEAMGSMGAAGILHRYQSPEDTINDIGYLKYRAKLAIPSVGVGDAAYSLAKRYFDAGADAICIDVAHGDSCRVMELIFALKGHSTHDVPIIAGNVCTYEGAKNLAEQGADMIKVGVGPGAACSTRIITGHGIPQATAIMECARVKERYPNVKIIADGGIRSSGDIVKAFALGADAVMVGSLLAGTDEAPGVIEIVDNVPYKTYAGMASKLGRDQFQATEDDYVPEGVSTKIKCKGAVKNVINQLAGGMRSGCSYSGVQRLANLREAAILVRVTPAGIAESHPHILSRG